MPEFCPQHTPRNVDDFIRGWSQDALRVARRDCINFQAANKADLAEYYERRKPNGDYSPQECAGHDFFLTRNRHGSGFWDRGLGELGDRLAAAAQTYGETDTYLYRGRLYF